MVPQRPALILASKICSVIGAVGAITNGFLALTGSGTFLGVPASWSNLVWSLVLVLSCALWVNSIHKPYRDYCDHKKRRVTLYRHLSDLREAGTEIVLVLHGREGRAIPKTDQELNQLRTQILAWFDCAKSAFAGTDWESAFAASPGPLEDFRAIYRAVQDQYQLFDRVESRLDDTARD